MMPLGKQRTDFAKNEALRGRDILPKISVRSYKGEAGSGYPHAGGPMLTYGFRPDTRVPSPVGNPVVHLRSPVGSSGHGKSATQRMVHPLSLRWSLSSSAPPISPRPATEGHPVGPQSPQDGNDGFSAANTYLTEPLAYLRTSGTGGRTRIG
jgi:hypothetical protein